MICGKDTLPEPTPLHLPLLMRPTRFSAGRSWWIASEYPLFHKKRERMRHYSPSVRPLACAAVSSRAYSSSLTLKPMHFVRRAGFTMSGLTPGRFPPRLAAFVWINKFACANLAVALQQADRRDFFFSGFWFQ